MKANEIKKVTKALNELQIYFLLKHYSTIVSEIKVLDDKILLSLTIQYFNFEDDQGIISTLIAQRNQTLEEFSWELLGESELENELDIIASLFDKISFIRVEDALKITLLRFIE